MAENSGLTEPSRNQTAGLEYLTWFCPYLLPQQRPMYVRGLYRRALSRGEEVDGVLIPCANWPTTAVAQSLEDDMGLPVVTSNMAKIWAALSELGLSYRVEGPLLLLWQVR